MKKVVKFIVIMVMCIVTVSGTNTPAMAIDYTMHAQVENVYKKAVASYGGSFQGYCGACVGWQLYHMGINTSAICLNGNATYDHYKNLSYTTGGYKVTTYPSSRYTVKSALNALTANGTKNAYNILICLEKGNTSSSQQYGHAVFIHAIIDGVCYFAESSGLKVKGLYHPAGTAIVCDLDYVCDYIYMFTDNGYTPVFEGVVHFGGKSYSPTVTKTVNCDFRVTIPANYRLTCYDSATTQTASGRFISAKSASYRLGCTQQITLSNGTVRYKFVSSEGYTLYFDYDSSKMTMTQNHDFSTTKTAATCTTKGKITKKCTECGYTTTENIAALGHSYGSWTTTKKATCTSNGQEKRQCTRTSCSSYETRTVNSTGHNYSKSWTVISDSTCVTTGVKSHLCLNCSAAKDMELIPAKGHSFGEWITERNATVKQEGMMSRTCKTCKTKETKTIMKLQPETHEHKLTDWKVEKQATCSVDGRAERHCTSCDQKEYMSITATGHTFGNWETSDDELSLQRVCLDCEFTETADVAYLKPEENDQEEVTSSTVSVPEISDIEQQELEKESDKNQKQSKIPFAVIMFAFVAVVAAGVVIIVFSVKKNK